MGTVWETCSLADWPKKAFTGPIMRFRVELQPNPGTAPVTTLSRQEWLPYWSLAAFPVFRRKLPRWRTSRSFRNPFQRTGQSGRRLPRPS